MEKHDIEWMHPSKLRSYKYNPNTHSESQIDQLMILIEQFGFPEAKAIVVDENLEIIHGEGRWTAATRMDLPSIPVQVISGLSKEEKQSWRIGDNAIARKSKDDPILLAKEVQALAATNEDAIAWTVLEGFEIEEALSVDLDELLNSMESDIGDEWEGGNSYGDREPEERVNPFERYPIAVVVSSQELKDFEVWGENTIKTRKHTTIFRAMVQKLKDLGEW